MRISVSNIKKRPCDADIQVLKVNKVPDRIRDGSAQLVEIQISEHEISKPKNYEFRTKVVERYEKKFVNEMKDEEIMIHTSTVDWQGSRSNQVWFHSADCYSNS